MSNIYTSKRKYKLIFTNFIATMDLSAALEYYGSDKARLDFFNNREVPTELLNKASGKQKGNGQRKVSVVEHLFEKDHKDVKSATVS